MTSKTGEKCPNLSKKLSIKVGYGNRDHIFNKLLATPISILVYGRPA